VTADVADTTLRNAHRAALAGLAACALVIALRAEGADAATTETMRPYAYAATALAVGSIFTRRRRPPPSADGIDAHVLWSLLSLGFAAGVGAIGVAASVAGTPLRAALLYAFAGVIFALRPPPPASVAASASPPETRGSA
jgi:peptidoglycan/LPS O-acetylase OafA/YrhL